MERIGFSRVGEWWVKLDMPDMRDNWREMLSCVAFLALLALVFIAGLCVGGVM